MALTLSKRTINFVMDQGATFEKVIYAQNSAGGNVTISMTATNTAYVDPGQYVYDVEYTQSDGTTVERVCQGIITCSAESTK